MRRLTAPLLVFSLLGGCLVELNSAGSRVLMAVALPGAPRAISLDRQGHIWLTGSASGPAFVAKVSPAGKLLFKLSFGRRGGATGNAIALDTAGNGYITGSTFSTDFPTSSGALQRTYRSGVPGCPPTCPFVSSSGFAMKLRPNG